MRVLLTAIEPFGGESVNSSLEAVRLVEKAPPAGVELSTAVLPNVFGESLDVLRELIGRTDPQVVIATGQAANRPDLTVEKVFINLDDATRAPDNKGNQPLDQPVVDGGPDAYFAFFPVKRCVEAMTSAGVPATLSHTAGTYVCNHIAYGLAHLIATERAGMRGGFIHVPYTPGQAAAREKCVSMSCATAAEGLRAAIVAATGDVPGTGASSTGGPRVTTGSARPRWLRRWRPRHVDGPLSV